MNSCCIRLAGLVSVVLLQTGCLGSYDFNPAQPPLEIAEHLGNSSKEDPGPFLTSTVDIEIDGATREEVFDAFLFLPIQEVFVGSEDFPAVEGFEVQTEGWRGVGSRRLITQADGNTCLEAVRVSERPEHLSFVTWELTGQAGLVIGYTVVEWWFREIDAGVHMTWRFSFRPRAWPSSLLLGGTVKDDWQAYMQSMAKEFKSRVESTQTD